MTPRQFITVALLLGAGLLAAGIARPGNWEVAPGLPSEPVKAMVATLVEPPAVTSQPPIRVILPSPYEER